MRSRRSMPSRNTSTPFSSMDWIDSSSTPAAPRLLRTRFHASRRTSLCRSGRTARGNAVSCSAWRSRKVCAEVLALCLWGCWASRPCPRAYPQRKRDRSRVPSLQRFLAAFTGTTNPSDSLPAPRDFSPALYARSLPDVGCRVGSLLFRIIPS